EFLLSTKALIESAQERSGAAAVFLKDVSEHYRNIQQDSAGQSADGTVSLKELAGEANSVTRLINTIVLAAMQKRASDVHLESYESGVRIRYRIDGVLCPATGALDPAHHRALVTRIKVMAKLDIAETRVPQDGHFKLAVNEGETDFRISVLPAIYGEDVVIRILDKSSIMRDVKGLSIDGLGFGADISKKIRRSINEPYGMILITGPTGSGKTTTLYAALSELNSSEEKIVTIEDPVEYRIPGIVQVAVNEKKNLTFARGLRSMLRHDPDKIVVGEIRDTETAQIAVQSALTGHLVFSTVHANNACDVIGRFSHMGINIYSFISALNCVVAQRLIRLICEKCRAAAPAGAADRIGPDDGEYKNIKWFEGKGCAECGGTGYKGRAAIGEYLFISPEIRRIIMEKRPSDELLEAAVNGGMTTLRKAAIKIGALGLTTISEINRVTFAE
ncbi:MAG: GspE/PulE family protein, partial [bacterium]